ncbi:Bro-N domain-containing protein [Pasteurella multocida]|uniref:BRO-N domain-containing protein n=1 Tax=Pasteurella multocida TaxID=747 RepID=UPI002D1E7275|nr:Bro-N domain-containing protein [Pasteurella multocida]MEB4494256.1 Bro-N domain-containing protein [Pasteurella multocida]MEB4502061.1 Bro-N domain-containing protein [Pasteurella multocida]MEB4511686.1 Bro-N domain-containing protein [Pasteurella multocida]MEB4532284.1 Bro-N domain-containing protein [Pasteurella multocida]MEB4536533.1 Bro-N domain-containing protein [Pasteurella multocida]
MTTKTQLSTFLFETHIIRTLSINNEPWFVVADLCKALELSSPTKAILNLDEDEVALNSIQGISKGNDKVNLVSESGMYTLILRCRDAVKKGSTPHRFRKWVTAEVLPQIRKTGKYEVQPQQLALPEPDLNLTAIQNSEETLALIIQLYSYCFQAHEMQEKLQNTSIAKLMENQIGGQYLYNFKHPLEQVMAKAKKYVHSNTERLALVKAVNNLLN